MELHTRDSMVGQHASSVRRGVRVASGDVTELGLDVTTHSTQRQVSTIFDTVLVTPFSRLVHSSTTTRTLSSNYDKGGRRCVNQEKRMWV